MFQILVGIHALISVPLAWLISHYLLARYRKAIDASMRQSTGVGSASVPIDALSDSTSAEGTRSRLNIQILSEHDSVPLTSEGKALLRRVIESPRRAGRAYGVAGLVHGLIMAALVILIVGSEFSVQRYLVLALFLAWPVVPCVVHVAVADWRLKIIGPLVIALLVFLLSGLSVSQFLQLWAIMMGVPTVAILMLGNRSIRAVGSLVLIGVVLAITGVIYSLDVAFYMQPELIGAYGSLTLATLLLLGMGAVAAWWFIRWYARRYTEKRESDQVLMMDAWWLLFTIWECGFLATFGDVWGLLGLLAFIGYKIVLSIRLRAASPDDPTPGGKRLLLLRVFGHRRRTERLLEEVGRAWRHIGTIQLVAGTDLATYALEPHEFYEYLSRRLSRQLIRTESDIADRLEQLDEAPSWDGRYRLQDLVSSADAWQAVFRQLAVRSSAVLMDLRGFTEEREGAIYELNHLIQWMPLCRIVLIIDSSTDQEALLRIINDTWTRLDALSPNRDRETTLKIIDVENNQRPAQVRMFLSLLCDAALKCCPRGNVVDVDLQVSNSEPKFVAID